MIARDGDLGALGTDNLGDAGLGVSPENLNAFREAVNDFRRVCAEVEAAENQALKAVAMVEGWVTVGEKALAILGPILQTVAARHAAAPSAETPAVLTRASAIASQMNGILTHLAGELHLPGMSPPVPA